MSSTVPALVPYPYQASFAEQTVAIRRLVVVGELSSPVRDWFTGALQQCGVTVGSAAEALPVMLDVAPYEGPVPATEGVDPRGELVDERYRLQVAADGVRLSGASEAAVFRGLTTLV